MVIKLAVHRSLASCPGSSPKECSLWKIPSPYTLGTLPQENHNLTSLNRTAFIRKQNPFVYFAVVKLAVHRSLGQLPWLFTKGMLLMGNSFSRHSWHTASGKPHLTSLNRAAFVRKQNPFVYFAVVKLAVHRSLASCPGSSPKECSLWETPAPDTLGTLPQGNHNLTSLNRTAFIRKQNPFVFFAVKKQTDLHVLSGC